MSRLVNYAIACLCLCATITCSPAVALHTSTAENCTPIGTYVGELQEQWQFPSDHIPIGMTYEGLHILSWNVLDSNYMEWVIEKNTQGLSRSMIADMHRYIEGTKLTVRDRYVVDLLLTTIDHPTHPRSVIMLQECNEAFLAEVRTRLPDHWQMIAHEETATLVDRSQLDVVHAHVIRGVYTNSPKRPLQEIVVQRLDNDEEIRLINVHIPGDPAWPSRYEFCNYLARSWDQDMTTIVMGDFNFNECELTEALEKAFQGASRPFTVHTCYCTNISPSNLASKAIDHFIVYSESNSIITLNTPEQVMPGVPETVALLMNERASPSVPQ